MLGTIHIIRPGQPHQIMTIRTPPDVATIRHWIGNAGLRQVSDFDTLTVSQATDPSGYTPCVVFCDEQAELKQLPRNGWASSLWTQSRMRKFGRIVGAAEPGVLLGPVVIVSGDEELMSAMIPKSLAPGPQLNPDSTPTQ